MKFNEFVRVADEYQWNGDVYQVFHGNYHVVCLLSLTSEECGKKEETGDQHAVFHGNLLSLISEVTNVTSAQQRYRKTTATTTTTTTTRKD